jgi:hypothetical protein
VNGTKGCCDCECGKDCGLAAPKLHLVFPFVNCSI